MRASIRAASPGAPTATRRSTTSGRGSATATWSSSRRPAGSSSTCSWTPSRTESAAGVVTVELIQGLLLAFAIVVILMNPYIRLLGALGFRKHIRVEGPQSHYVKEGTPTMGGLLIVMVVLGIYLFLYQPGRGDLRAAGDVGQRRAARRLRRLPQREDRRRHQRSPEVIWLTRRRDRGGLPDPVHLRDQAIAVPFVGAVDIDPIVYIFFAAFAIIAAANGVNITDGLDGLSGGTVAIAFVAYMLIALLNVPNQNNLGILCAIIIGALLGFLWFNVHPAQIFIGDSGALSLGATLAVTALITGQILVLPLIGIIFVVETASVIIQRATSGPPAASASSGSRPSITTSSSPAGTRRRSRSGSGSSGSWRRCSA